MMKACLPDGQKTATINQIIVVGDGAPWSTATATATAPWSAILWIRNPDQMAPDAELPLSNGSNLIL
jgi:hypothetical protein